MQSTHCQYRYGNLDKKCSYPRYGDGRFCIFHKFDDIDGKNAEFNKRFEAIVKAAETSHDVDELDCEGFVFPKVYFENIQFTKKTNMSYCRFTRKTQFYYTQFYDIVDFSHSRFMGSTIFYNCNFAKEIRLNNSFFSDKVSFGHCHFGHNIFCERAKFLSEISVSNSQIIDNFILNNARFKGSGNFSELKFTGLLECSNTIWGERCTFKNAVFLSKVNFSDSRFDGDVNFSHSNFSKEAKFDNCEFKGTTTFRETKFQKPLSMNEIKAVGNFFFNDAELLHRCFLWGSEFAGEAHFENSYFGEFVDFSYNKFLGPTNFSHTRFHKDRKFFHAEFCGKLIISESGIVDAGMKTIGFEDTIINYSGVWKNKNIEFYSFENAIIKNINLSGKRLASCNFTGAIIINLFAVNWSVGHQMKELTKYVYTEFEEIEIEERGRKLTNYKPNTKSRVPGGRYFGVGEMENYFFPDFVQKDGRLVFYQPFPVYDLLGMEAYLHLFEKYMRFKRKKTVYVSVFPMAAVEGLVVSFDSGSKMESEIDFFVNFVKFIFEPYDSEIIGTIPEMDLDENYAFKEEFEEIFIHLQNDIIKKYKQANSFARTRWVDRFEKLIGSAREAKKMLDNMIKDNFKLQLK